MTPSDILRTAAENITDETWCQGVAAHGLAHLPKCGLMHLHRVAFNMGFEPYYRKYYALVEDMVDIISAKLGMRLHVWNDTPGRTATEVRELFLKVAEELESSNG